MPSKKKPEKLIICTHHEQVTGTVGTCIFCRQVRDYGKTKKGPLILKRGEINGILTEIHPPEKTTEMATRKYMKRAVAPTVKVALGSQEA